MSRPGTILVTGAAAGIGLATAKALIAMNHRVVAADLDQEMLERAAEALGSGFVPMPVDLADADDTGMLVARVADELGLDAIVHSAGLFPQVGLAETSLDLWDRVMAVNVRAAFILARDGSERMRNGGSLVFLTSGAGAIAAAAYPFQRAFALYGASKAALDRFAAGIATDLASMRIAVTTITPGAFVETPGTARVDLSEVPDIPRIDVERVGAAVAWLAAAPRLDHAGVCLDARLFGREWGDGARSETDKG